MTASVVIVGLWLLTHWRGAVGIARADDWSYLLTQFAFSESGAFQLNNWAVTMLVGQTVLASPIPLVVGQSITALQVFVALTALLALIAAYLVVRHQVAVWPATVALLSLALGPLFALSAVSFMTDVPALLFLSLSLLAGMRALKGSRISWTYLTASALFALVAFTFRDYALVAGLVVLGVAAVRALGQRRNLIAVAGIALAEIITAGALYAWRHSLPNDLKLDGWEFEFSLALVSRALITLGLLSIPALAFVSPLKLWAKLRALGLWAPIAVFAFPAVVAAVAGLEFLGNVIHPYGGTWLVNGSGVRMWPLWVNRLLILLGLAALVGLISIALLVGARIAHMIRADGLWTTIKHQGASSDRSILIAYPVALLTAHVAATLILGTWFIDRYFILLLPFWSASIIVAATLLDVRVRFRPGLISAAVLALFAVFGLHVADFSASTEGARWRLAEQVAAMGYERDSINGGVEWFSFHQDRPGIPAQVVPTREGRNWWTERYPDQNVCVTVNIQDEPGSGLVQSSNRTLLGIRFSHVATLGPDVCEQD